MVSTGFDGSVGVGCMVYWVLFIVVRFVVSLCVVWVVVGSLCFLVLSMFSVVLFSWVKKVYGLFPPPLAWGLRAFWFGVRCVYLFRSRSPPEAPPCRTPPGSFRKPLFRTARRPEAEVPVLMEIPSGVFGGNPSHPV